MLPSVLCFRRLLSLALTLLLAGSPLPAAADPEHYSRLEADILGEALGQLGGVLDEQPEGKIIEGIDIVTLKVFDHRDPVPKFVNIFHRTTSERIVRQELLFEPGERYSQARIDESKRNMRTIVQLTVVLIVATRGSGDDRVRVLVITKDVWSIRLTMVDPAISREGTTVGLGISEINLLGTHKTVGALSGIDPGRWWLGGWYTDPRVAGSQITAHASAQVFRNRRTGETEGSSGRFIYSRPLYSLRTRWGFTTYLGWVDDVERAFRGAEVRTYDSPVTPASEALPMEWNREVWFGFAETSRRFGRRDRLDLSLGAEFLWTHYDPEQEHSVARTALLDFRRREVPPDQHRTSPFVELRAHSARFLQVYDLATLALEEDFKLGHDLTARLYAAHREIGASRDFVGLYGGAQYTIGLGDGLLRGVGRVRAEMGKSHQSDVLLSGVVHLVSPRLGFGRVVSDWTVAHRVRDYLRERFAVGDSHRLRGYLPQEFRGKDLLASTLELRTRSFELLSAQVGGVVFYDVADAPGRLSRLRPKSSAGVGLRLLLPQLDREVMRFDWGFPLDRGRAGYEKNFWLFPFFTFGPASAPPTSAYSPLPAALQ